MPIVLHGSSGVPDKDIQQAISLGVRKVNIDTDLRLAATGAIRQFLGKNPAEFDPRKYNQQALNAMREICKARYEAFGTAGQVPNIKPIKLEKMAERYAKGEWS